jgi:predicted CxxxxCH...CXXCH cytochrome family protein
MVNKIEKELQETKLWTRSSLLLTFTLLFSLFIGQGWLQPGEADAAGTDLMHNSANPKIGTTNYGTWGTSWNCATCHNPATTNVKLVSGTILGRSVVFTRMTASLNGTQGVLGNDQRTYALNSSTNVCEVCHHRTTYHQYSSSKIADKVHAGHPSNRKDCTSCHAHGAGFKASCDICHGYPPINTTIGTSTGLATPATLALGSPATLPGAHAVHVTTRLITCSACHMNNQTSGHQSGTNVLIGFNINNANWPKFPVSAGSVAFGTFTGNSAGAKTAASSYAGTVVFNAANTRNSCNVYCHGRWTGSGRTLRASWIGTNQAACGTCHATSYNTSFTAGSHGRHAGTNTAAGQLAVICTDCHGTAPTNNAHVNGRVVWNLNQSNTRIGANAQYNGFKNNSAAAGVVSTYKTCSGIYCHSSVQNSTGTALATPTATPTWGGAALSCTSCHANPPANNAHAVHTGAPYSYACSACHNTAGSGTAKHANYATDIVINSTYGAVATYSQGAAPAPGSGGFGTCNTSNCHGSRSPTWGVPSATNNCGKCHGIKISTYTNQSSANVAPGGAGTDTYGNTADTSARVGAHQTHLNGTNNISAKIKCGECHKVPASINAALHLDYTTATMTFGPLSKKGTVAHVPTVARTGGVISCSTTYCHTGNYAGGTGTVPAWNSSATYLVQTIADCTRCHALPPTPGSGSHAGEATVITIAGLNQCSSQPGGITGCHPSINGTPSAGNIFFDKSLHINGQVEGGDCLSCHASVQGVRAAVVGQFASQSHHVQKAGGVTLLDCYQCHMEAKNDGTPNAIYHLKTSTAAVNLVVWGAGTRGTTYISYTANGKRSSIGKLNQHCLSCHNTANANQTPFLDTYRTDQYSPEARLVTPKAKTSVLSRYSSTRTVAWSQYQYSSATGGVKRYGTNQKNRTTKALSAHGNASKNQMPAWAATANGSGEDGNMADIAASQTLSSNRNVFCFDCHNSHGSKASGITSSYSSATGRYKGGLLKTTNAGVGGYFVNYSPAKRTVIYRNYSSTTLTTTATLNPGANICNDCHNDNTTAYKNVVANKPWNIFTTYSSTRAINGYWSTPYFDNYTFASAKRTTYKAGAAVGNIKDLRKPMGGHFGTSINGASASHSQNINGLCTPCHDPHGVSSTMTAVERGKSVPLLKGTWVTSPYREDKAEPLVKRGGGSKYAGMNSAGAVPGYHIDQNTFMVAPVPVSGGAASTTAASNKRTQRFRSFSILSSALNMHTETTPSAFAGLCLECHNQLALTGAATATTSKPWMSKERVHQSVAGWASTNGTNVSNKVHAYTCSKCHAPHVSRLPRLMVTNCLDVRHFNRAVSGGSINTTAGTTTPGNILQSTLTSSALGAGRFPGGGSRYSGTPGTAQNPGGWWFQTNGGGNATQPTAQSFGSNCHNAANAGGAAYNPTKQIWNKKTRW